jgi:sulfate adenylyltransferase subunit 2
MGAPTPNHEDGRAEAGSHRRQLRLAIGGARRDEERSRAKEHLSVARPAMPDRGGSGRWHLYAVNSHRVKPCESFRYQLDRTDVWTYIAAEKIDVVPLYFAALRPTVMRSGQIIVVDDDRMRLEPGERPTERMVRFRSLGCYPLSAAVESDAADMGALLKEMAATRMSERAGRLIDQEQDSSMERKKREGYF